MTITLPLCVERKSRSGFSSYEWVDVSHSFLCRSFVHHFLSSLLGHLLLGEEPGDKHWYLSTVLRIRRMRREQIPFFELNCDQDVGGSQQRKHQMCHGHRRRRPEREEPTNVQRVPHEFVRARSSELQGCVLF